MTVSIIVPVYHGRKYIRDIVAQAEENAGNISGEVELLLVNDAPDDPIVENLDSDTVVIKVMNTNINRGIHGTRVKGLNTARGEYILFLDQDDKIAPDYIKKQLTMLGDADAVVCAVIQNQKRFYHSGKTLQECICREHMVQRGNFIVSPGQVLLKKAAVPAFWKNNILKCNGADDWFLWVCMLCAGKKFTVNQEILFEHVVHAGNTSASGFAMLDSMRETYEKLKKNTDCTEEDLCGIRRMIESCVVECCRERDKFHELYCLLDDWMGVREKGKSISDYINEKGHKKVSVYGRGRVGLRLARELQAGRIEVNCFIDRDADLLPEDDIRTILPDECGKEEAVIISLVGKDADAVSRLLKNEGVKQLYFISDIIRTLQNVDCG